MTVDQLLKVLKTVPESTEIYFVRAEDPEYYLDCAGVNVEYPPDQEGEINVSFKIQIPEDDE